MGDLMRRWAVLANAQLHPVTVTGGNPLVFTSGIAGKLMVSAESGATVTVCGKNLFDGVFPYDSVSILYRQIYVGFKTVTVSSDVSQVVQGSSRYSNLFVLPGRVSTGAATGTNDVYNGNPRTITPVDGYISLAYRNWNGVNPATANTMIEVGTSPSAFEAYSGSTELVSKVGINTVIADRGEISVTYWTN